MFTGLVEEMGIIRAVRPQGGGYRITVGASTIMNDVKVDDSISINGVCQTVVACTPTQFDVEAVEETMKKTTFAQLRVGQYVNLERAMQLGARMGGHIVQGHVDCRAEVVTIQELGTSWMLTVRVPEHYTRYIVPVGSICIHGVSLTVADIQDTLVTVAVIPHTWRVTVLHSLTVGAHVNIECDILGKYIEKLLASRMASSSEELSSSKMTPEWLVGLGY